MPPKTCTSYSESFTFSFVRPSSSGARVPCTGWPLPRAALAASLPLLPSWVFINAGVVAYPCSWRRERHASLRLRGAGGWPPHDAMPELQRPMVVDHLRLLGPELTPAALPSNTSQCPLSRGCILCTAVSTRRPILGNLGTG